MTGKDKYERCEKCRKPYEPGTLRPAFEGGDFPKVAIDEMNRVEKQNGEAAKAMEGIPLVKNSKDMRKELWDYLESIGLKTTTEQHDRVKEMIDRIAEKKAGVWKSHITAMNRRLELANTERRRRRLPPV